MARQFSFSRVPTIRKKRSKFDLSHTIKTSGNLGTLYPFYVQEVYPGDTFKVKSNIVARVTSSFLKPVMDNAFIDTYYFFVPNRLTFNQWQEVMGENNDSSWARRTNVSVPVTSAQGTVSSGSVADYMGLPVGSVPKGINILPFRAFALIYNEWFRDENNIDPVHISKGSVTSSEVFNNSDWSPNNYFGKPPKVAKLHDYFTSCLPGTQKGSPVSVSVLSDVPVSTKQQDGISSVSSKVNFISNVDELSLPNIGTSGVLFPGLMQEGTGSDRSYYSTVASAQSGFSDNNISLVPSNLWALTSELGSATVNDLRYAFQLQKLLERDARGGTRYTELLQSHFGVTSPDSRLQRTEFLGGRRVPINVQQVAQTSQPTTDSPLGAVGAYSLSNGQSRMTKGFVEHGFIIGVMCVRQFHTYQQGIERFWQRSDRLDYYDPVFANIGEQPVWQSELYALGKTELKDTVFGYNEAWADLRYRPSRITGQMRSGGTGSLDVWHFGDNYQNAPTLSESFINETTVYFDRTLSVPSTSIDNFIFDIYVNSIAYRPLPTYSVPSLIDHN